MDSSLRTIGVLTSGGDAPGMNACIRAVVRSALNKGLRVMGIRKGYVGLLRGDVMEMHASSVADIIHRGGTVLYTARCPEFFQVEYQDRAAEMCRIFGIDGLVVIGGDGSFRGAQKLSQRGISVVGVPGTIDRDIACSEYTIGFDSAVNIVVDSIARLRDTSASHERCSVVEVMGRNCGELALWSGIATGADAIMIPEDEESQGFDHLVRVIMENRARGKSHNIVIVAEGVGNAQELSKKIHDATGVESRCTILGHIQRGGSPTALDIKHASMMGYLAVEALYSGETNRLICVQNGKYVNIDIDEGLAMKREPSLDIWKANLQISTY
ncbi:MAG: 6-phosphofructokinase [Firmicutes bacterium]|nr:6-phosphofructokinase [Bacillota bacterium]